MANDEEFEDEPEIEMREDKIPKIIGFRRLNHSDVPRICQMMGTVTFDLFGDVQPGHVFERSCLSLVQFNENEEIVSNISLCNFPNVPSVPANDWIAWMTRHYEVPEVNEKNTLFIHLLVWDSRYNEEFLKIMLNSIFISTSYCHHVVMIVPPGLKPDAVEMFGRRMKKFYPVNERDSEMVQTLYVSLRQQEDPKLKIRRVVYDKHHYAMIFFEKRKPNLEQKFCPPNYFYVSNNSRHTSRDAPNPSSYFYVSKDTKHTFRTRGVIKGLQLVPRTAFNIDNPKSLNKRQNWNLSGMQKYRELSNYVGEEDNDDLIPIIDAESKILREVYGDYYISEMMRHSDDGNRQMIVAENEGRATGVMCLNRIFDVDILIENFELAPYNDLRKFSPMESPISKSSSSSRSSSSSSGFTKTASATMDPETPRNRERQRFSLAIAHTIRFEDEIDGEIDPEGSAQPIVKSVKFSEKLGRINPSVNFESVLRTSVFAEAIHELPLRSLASSVYTDEDDDDLPLSHYSEKTVRSSSSQSDKIESNAFVLELFSMNKNIHETHGVDYLEAAFECFPDLDYCIMLLPSTQPFFTFLENFARVPLRFDRDFPMELYVTHRATLSCSFTSRKTIPYDRESIVNFLQKIPKKKIILDDFDETIIYPEGEKRCYVFLCGDQIIGLAIICSELRLDELCRFYDVEDYVSIANTSRDDHAELLHFVTVPVFSVYDKIFFCELMRLSCTTVLYYRLYDNETTAVNRTQPLITCLDAMIPVKSRTRFHHPYLQNESESSDTNDEKFSLFLMTPRLAMMTKSVVNSKIIVIGASDCGVAFCEYLAFQGSNSDIVNFTNLTIVSPNGVPFEGKETMDHVTMIPYKGKYCYQYRKFVPCRVWINVVHGVISQINRKEKYVVVSGLGTLSYDYLVLTCGLQYQIPKFQDNREIDGNSIQETVPLNSFYINDDLEAATCLERLKELTNDFTTKKFIVIYGRNIESLCTLNNLLESGIKGSWIIMIEPKYSDCGKPSDIFFEDDEVTEAVEKAIRKSGVKIISGWDLKDWVLEISENVLENENTPTSVIKSLRIESKTENKFVACDALIYFGDKTLPIKTFMAISRAGLVFDGRLVIDPDCRTNDPSVFAAGSITKYSRKYNAERWQHQYYDSIEVGEWLGKNLKQKIESHMPDERNRNPDNSKTNSQDHTKLPIFRAPLIVYCRLPGGLHYLHVRKPGKKIPRVIDIARGSYGEVLITGNTSATSEIGYFRIRFNPFNRVETITCLRKKDFRVQDFITLYGKHDSLLNNVKLRFQNSLIIDFFAYFAEPWAAALFHDKFDSLRDVNRAILLSEVDVQGSSLIQDMLNVCINSNWKELNEENRQHIESKYAGSVYQDAISSNLINFLQEEEELLPMYCNPCKLRRQLQGN